jgi:hypothetical protein
MCFNYTLYILFFHSIIELIYIYILFLLTFSAYCHKVTFVYSRTCDNFNLVVY